MDKYVNFTYKTLEWYSLNKRDLAWRHTKNPYKIWLSEIILQQTRVAQGTAYYHKFIRNYPNIYSLANASEDNILKDWQGLGYYSRARNLHFTAKYIQNNFQGKFPDSYEEIIKLKGIGEYTAAAIASIAYGIPKAVVDGNIYRLLSRYFGIESPIDTAKGKKEFQELAQFLMNEENPAIFNQSLMEFGALQCVPSRPNCELCPLNDSCFALQKDKIKALPLKSKKIKQRDRFFNYLVIEQKNQLFLKKRKQKDIWQNLYDFPLIETNASIDHLELLKLIETNRLFPKGEVKILSTSKTYKHLLSHQKIYAVFTQISINDDCMLNVPGCFPIDKNQLLDFAVPKLLDNYLRNDSNLLYLL